MLTKEAVAAFQNELSATLKVLAEKHGMKMDSNRATYYPETGMIKTTIVTGLKSITGGVNAIYVNDTAKFGDMFGLTTKDIGVLVIKLDTGTYTMEGMKGRNTVVGRKDTDGKLYKLDGRRVAIALGR